MSGAKDGGAADGAHRTGSAAGDDGKTEKYKLPETYLKGPWVSMKSKSRRYCTEIRTAEGMHIIDVEDSTYDKVRLAALIAAAPEMYGLMERYVEIEEQLETANFHDSIDLCEELADLVEKFKAVLRKARGGQ